MKAKRALSVVVVLLLAAAWVGPALAQKDRDSTNTAGTWEDAVALLEEGLAAQHAAWYVQAIELYERALLIVRSLDERYAEAVILDNLGTCYRALWDYPRAIELHERSLAIKREIGDRSGEAVSLNNLGLCYEALASYQQAIPLYREALATFQETGDLGGGTGALIGLGRCYYGLGDPQRACAHFTSAYEVAITAGGRRAEGEVLLGLCQCRSALGDYAGAVDLCGAALRVFEEVADHWSEAQAALHLGECMVIFGKVGDAVSVWRQAVDVVEGLTPAPSPRSAQMRLLLYEKLVVTLVAMGEHAEALRFAERAKATRFADIMVETWISTLYLRPRGLNAKIADFDSGGSQEPARQISDDHAPPVAALGEGYPALGGAFIASPEDAGPHAARVQASLSEGIVALNYYVTQEELLLWVITRDGIEHLGRIPISRSDLADKVREFHDELNTPPMPGEEPARRLRAMELGQELYEILIAPAEEHVKGAEHFLILPSDVLFYVPFAALVSCPGCEGAKLYWEGEYLIERTTVSYAPSLATLYGPLQQHSDAGYRSVLAVGNPTSDLVHAEEEARQVASVFARGDLLLREEATRERVFELLAAGDYDVLHFAAHGFYNRHAPLLSGIALADDATLYVVDLLGFDLAARLAVIPIGPAEPLAESGEAAGNELWVLSQTLFTAGIPSAVLSLLCIHDASARYLMVAFYGHLLKVERDKAQALRDAQLSLLSTDRYRHPYYWAPFVLYGDWR